MGRAARAGEREAGPIRRVVLGDNLPFLQHLASESVDLIYVDPPFNTGSIRRLRRVRTRSAENGPRPGFHGRRYEATVVSELAYSDRHADYLGFLEPRLREAHRVLARHGSIYVHLDCREAHRVRGLLDEIFGVRSFLNEIIWAYDYGGRSTRRWPAKHDNILLYVKDRSRYYFSLAEVERIPYLAPKLVGPEKAARGKTPTDTWWHTIVPTNSRERTGYPTQKPVGIVERAVRASCPPGGLVLDFFAGSGTTGEAALRGGRQFLLVDESAEAWRVMRRRFRGVESMEWIRAPRPQAPPRSGPGA